jgi:protein gp37
MNSCANGFDEMARFPHIYMVLTKRADRAASWPYWPDNIWPGVTVEHPSTAWRLEALRSIKARNHFVSFEPLLASLAGIDLTGIQQAIVGRETGTGYREMEMVWAREIRDAAVKAGCALFYKQASGPRPGRRPYLVEEDGSCWEWTQYPEEHRAPRQIYGPLRRQ